MTITEAARLVDLIAQDPSSQTFAAIWGWDYPLTREGLMLADLWDLTAAGKLRRPKPYPRPLPARRTETFGDAGGRTPAEVKAILRPAA